MKSEHESKLIISSASGINARKAWITYLLLLRKPSVARGAKDSLISFCIMVVLRTERLEEECVVVEVSALLVSNNKVGELMSIPSSAAIASTDFSPGVLGFCKDIKHDFHKWKLFRSSYCYYDLTNHLQNMYRN